MPRTSPYIAVAYGAGGVVVARAPLYGPPGHVHGLHAGFVRSLEASFAVPSRVTRIEILKGKTVLTAKRIGASAPRLRFLAPRRGARLRGNGTVTVRWSASDKDNDRLIAELQYAANGHSFKVIATGLRGGTARIPARLLSRSSRARLRLIVSDGYHNTAAVAGPFRTAGPTASVRIVSPTAIERLRVGTPITLAAQGLDIAGRPLRRVRYTWYLGKRRVAQKRTATITIANHGRYILRVVATGQGRRAEDRLIIRVA